VLKTNNRHEVLFYSEDATLIDAVARFIVPAMRSGNPAIVVATESHREALTRRLKSDSVLYGDERKEAYDSICKEHSAVHV
jgi:hypothetical protein